MKTITFMFFNAIFICAFGQQNPNSMKKMNLMAIEMSKHMDAQPGLEMVRYESGYMEESEGNFIGATPRVLIANVKYSFLGYADGRILDFEIGIIKVNKDGKLEKIKSVNDNKGKPVTDPIIAINDFEILKEYVPDDTGEYIVYLSAPKAGNRAGRYTILIYTGGEPTGNATSGNATGSNKGADNNSAIYDQNLKKTLDETGLEYTISKKGDFHVTVKTDDKRTQNVVVNSSIKKYNNLEVREMSSTISSIPHKKTISAANAILLLEQNASMKVGAWQLSGTTAPYSLSLSLYISPRTSALELKSMIETTGKKADYVEKSITRKDLF